VIQLYNAGNDDENISQKFGSFFSSKFAYYYYYYYYLNCKWVFTRWQWYYNKTQHKNNTHHTQTKHSTQNYTDNKGHTTHNEYNANTIRATANTIK
jgi:hypothetical protein